MATRPRRNDCELGDWRTHYEQLWKPMTPITQPYEGMTLQQFLAARQVLRDALAKFPEPVCHTCQNFSMGKCKQFGEVPAAFQRQPEACETWQWDSIPFASSDFVHDVVTSKEKRMRGYDY